MKPSTGAFNTHLAGGVLTLATIFKVTRADGTVYRFTDHDQDLVIAADGTYAAKTGYRRGALEQSVDLSEDGLSVEGVLESTGITEADILAGRYDGADVVVSLVNWADLTITPITLRKGVLGRVTPGEGLYKAELFPHARRLERTIGRLILLECDADLGDDRCGLTAGADFASTNGTITSVVTQRLTFDCSGFAPPAGGVSDATFYSNGKLTWTGGLNNGLKMELRTYVHATKRFTLRLPMPFNLQVGDTFTLHQGCKKTLAACRDDFDNVVNHRGFPHVPAAKVKQAPQHVGGGYGTAPPGSTFET